MRIHLSLLIDLPTLADYPLITNLLLLADYPLITNLLLPTDLSSLIDLNAHDLSFQFFYAQQFLGEDAAFPFF